MSKKSMFYITVFFGWLGLHKFLQKKPVSGLVYLFTLGLFSFGWLFDSIAAYKDMKCGANYVAHYAPAIHPEKSCFQYAQARGLDLSAPSISNHLQVLHDLRDADISHYQVIAANDERVCTYCRQRDGKIYPVNMAQFGVNLPPFHNGCRCTIIAYFND